MRLGSLRFLVGVCIDPHDDISPYSESASLTRQQGAIGQLIRETHHMWLFAEDTQNLLGNRNVKNKIETHIFARWSEK